MRKDREETMAFLSGIGSMPNRMQARRPSRCGRMKSPLIMSSVKAVEESLESTEDALDLVENTPFTKLINASPMRRIDREYYTREITDSVVAAVTGAREGKLEGNLFRVIALLPQLNPELDVYDRRFLLSIAWEIVAELAVVQKRTVKVMTQSPTKFGGLPLSVAGLRRNFQADLAESAETWNEHAERVRTGDIAPEEVADDDEVFIILSPTNSVSAPVIEDCMALIPVVGQRPIIMLNPRLNDVPSHSGVMQVQGRENRHQFLNSFHEPVHIRLLYTPGTSYPIRGMLWRLYPNPWQIWSKSETGKDEPEVYTLLDVYPHKPTANEMNLAFLQDSHCGGQGDVGLPPEFAMTLLLASSVMMAAWAFLNPAMRPHLP